MLFNLEDGSSCGGLVPKDRRGRQSERGGVGGVGGKYLHQSFRSVAGCSVLVSLSLYRKSRRRSLGILQKNDKKKQKKKNIHGPDPRGRIRLVPATASPVKGDAHPAAMLLKKKTQKTKRPLLVGSYTTVLRQEAPPSVGPFSSTGVSGPTSMVLLSMESSLS